jgi:hypothetical protein
MASGNNSACGIGWASGGQSQGYICGKLWRWWVVLGDKWEVAIAVAVELDGPVGAKVKGTFVENWR